MEQVLQKKKREKNKMLLTDVRVLDDLQVIEESKSKGTMRVRGTFQRAEEANSNNRIYPRTVLEGQITKLQPLITERRLCGELDHPQSDTVRLSNASHLVTKLWMKDNEVFGEAEVLNTPAGKVAQALISDGVKIGISSRGLGTLSEGVYGKTKTVKLVTFDLVADPSTRGAYPSLSESVLYTDEKYKRTLDQAVSEKVFLTVLKNKLNEGKKAKTKKKPIVDLGDLVNGKGDTDHAKKNGMKEDHRWNPFEERAYSKFEHAVVGSFKTMVTEEGTTPTTPKAPIAPKAPVVATKPKKGSAKPGYGRKAPHRVTSSNTLLRLLRNRIDDAYLKERRSPFGMGDTPLNRKAVSAMQDKATEKERGVKQTPGDAPEDPVAKRERIAKEKAARRAAGGSSTPSTPGSTETTR
jgi:hypothetical protein